MERVLFEESEGELRAHLGLKITVYRDHKKIDTVEEKKTCRFSESELLERDKIAIKIPYLPKKKGYYLFDLVVTDLNSMYGSTYRAVVKKDLSEK